MLNLWIGLCKGVQGLPRSIRDLGYREHSIEQVIRNQDNDICNPELIVASEMLAHSMLLEWKSGQNTEADQLQRYSRLTSLDLTNIALLSARAAKTFDVVIVGHAEHAERLKSGIVSGGYPFPLLLADDAGLHLA